MKRTLSLLFVFAGAFAILGQGLTIRSAFYLPSIKSHSSGGNTFNFLFEIGTNGDTGTAITGPVDSSGANLLVAWTSCYASTVAVADSKGNSWTALTNVISTGQGLQGFYCANPTVGSGHYFTNTGSGAAFPAIIVHGYAGSGASLDAQSGNEAGSVMSIQPGSRTPSQDNCLVDSAVAFFTANGMAVDSGFSTVYEVPYNGGLNIGLASAYLIQTSAGAVNPTWSNASTESGVSAAQAIFKR